MGPIGSDLRGGLFRRLFVASNATGPLIAVGLAVGLFVANLVLQGVWIAIAMLVMFGTMSPGEGGTVQAAVMGLFPAALMTVPIAWVLARIGGGDPRSVLNLRWPRLGRLGWPVFLAGFVVVQFVLIAAILGLLNWLNGSQMNAGPIEGALAEMTGERWRYLMALPGVIIGAPLGEELIFRGQIFTALSQTRLGFSGATLITSALWALAHYSGSWILVVPIFAMGLVLGWMLYRFGSLWLTFICHALWNAASSAIILMAGAQ